jgi:hypothetical protein
LSEFQSPSRRIFISSHSLPPLWSPNRSFKQEGQSTARPSAIERVRTTLIDRDEALQQARGDLERARTVATDWEAEVVSVRTQNRQVRTKLEEARSR